MPVYFLWDRERNLVKIGWTRRDVDSRLVEHQSRADGRLVLLKAIPGGRDLERALHRRFADRRVKGTEYFLPSREIESVLGFPLCPEPSRPTVRFLETAPEPEPPAPSGPADGGIVIMTTPQDQAPSGPTGGVDFKSIPRSPAPSGPADHIAGAGDMVSSLPADHICDVTDMVSIGCHHIVGADDMVPSGQAEQLTHLGKLVPSGTSPATASWIRRGISPPAAQPPREVVQLLIG